MAAKVWNEPKILSSVLSFLPRHEQVKHQLQNRYTYDRLFALALDKTQVGLVSETFGIRMHASQKKANKVWNEPKIFANILSHLPISDQMNIQLQN